MKKRIGLVVMFLCVMGMAGCGDAHSRAGGSPAVAKDGPVYGEQFE